MSRIKINTPWEQYIQTRRLSSNGQIAIPKHIRERFNLKDGQQIRIVANTDRIILTPLRKRKK
jgi:AbrB family looped-hinge helix DNA binding protein